MRLPLAHKHHVELLPPQEKKIFYPAVDGLRAFAALLVFCEHYLLYQHQPYLNWGWVGVDIFFVLSGFLITGILYDTRNTLHRFRNFYVRRSLRVFPLYYGVLAAILLLTPLLHWHWGHHWVLWPLYLANFVRIVHPAMQPGQLAGLEHLTSSNTGISITLGHFWSLCVEEQFYLVWPLLVFFLKDRRTLRNVCIAVMVLTPLLRAAANYLLPQHAVQAGIVYFATPFRMDALLCGALLALLMRGPHANRLLRMAWPLLLTSLGLLGAVWAVVVFGLHLSSSGQPSTPWISTIGLSLVDLAAAALLLLTLQRGTVFFRAFSLWPLRQLGQISYGFYVFHYIFNDLYLRLVVHFVGQHYPHLEGLVALTAFVCTVVLSLISFFVLETPFLRLKDRITVPDPKSKPRAGHNPAPNRDTRLQGDPGIAPAR